METKLEQANRLARLGNAMMPYEDACSSPVRPRLPLSPVRRWPLDEQVIATQLICILTSSCSFVIPWMYLAIATGVPLTSPPRSKPSYVEQLCWKTNSIQNLLKCQLISSSNFHLIQHRFIHCGINWRTIASWLNSTPNSFPISAIACRP